MNNNGAVWIVFGRETEWPTTVTLSSGTSTISNVSFIYGENTYAYFGYSTLGNGKYIIIGAFGNGAGKSYILKSRKEWPTNISISSIYDIELVGENFGDYFGNSVSILEDFDGDFLEDFLVGAYGWDINSTINSVGRTYIF
jgi:hypothetical protein